MNRQKLDILQRISPHEKYPFVAYGFTLPETLAVLTIAGIIGLLVAFLWQNMILAQRLNHAQDQVFQMMRLAQRQADLQNQAWQASFRQSSSGLQGAAHASNTLPQNISWVDFQPDVQIDISATTLRQGSGAYLIQFNPQGGVNGQLGRLAVKGDRQEMPKRCIFVSTLLGTLRKAHNQRCLR